MKLKALLVVRRIVSWQILCMDKCVYVVHSFYTRVDACARVYMSSLMPCVFLGFAHTAHTCVPFKLWVICTVCEDCSLTILWLWLHAGVNVQVWIILFFI